MPTMTMEERILGLTVIDEMVVVTVPGINRVTNSISNYCFQSRGM